MLSWIHILEVLNDGCVYSCLFCALASTAVGCQLCWSKLILVWWLRSLWHRVIVHHVVQVPLHLFKPVVERTCKCIVRHRALIVPREIKPRHWTICESHRFFAGVGGLWSLLICMLLDTWLYGCDCSCHSAFDVHLLLFMSFFDYGLGLVQNL